MANALDVSPRGQVVEVTERDRCWLDRHVDPLTLILSHLSVGDRCVSKAVCKLWKSLVIIPRPLPPSSDSAYFDSPCLMFSQRFSSLWKLFHSVYNDFYYLDIPELLEAEARFFKYGWLLMSREDLNLFFFNPVTKEKIELPPFFPRGGFISLCFTSPPTSSSCFVFGICTYIFPQYTGIGILNLGDASWKTFEYITNDDKRSMFLASSCHPVFLNGVYYCLDEEGKVAVFYPNNENRRWRVHHKCLKRIFPDEASREQFCDEVKQNYMVQVDKQILGVFVTHEERRVHLFRLDLSRMVWCRVQSLGNKCLFISRGSSFAEISNVRGMANKIYFPNFYNESGVVYSLISRKYHSLAGGFSNSKSYQLKVQETGIWIKPSIHAVSGPEVAVVECTRDSRMQFPSASDVLEFRHKEIGETLDEQNELSDSRPPLVQQTHPWLVICDGDNFQRHTFFSISQNRFHTRIIPEMHNKCVWCCSYGWLVLVDLDSNYCSLLHLKSMKTIQLPQLEKLRYCECILSRPPTDPRCYVLFNNYIENSFVFCKLGDSNFMKQTFEDEACPKSMTTFEGDVYGVLLDSHTFVRVELENGRVECKQVMEKKLPSIRGGNFRYYMVESCGELLFIHKLYVGSFYHKKADYFRVFRINTNEMVWEELKSIGCRTIFIGPLGGISCSVQEPGVRSNCIYFVEDNVQALYVYDLEDRSKVLVNPCPVTRRNGSLRFWFVM